MGLIERGELGHACEVSSVMHGLIERCMHDRAHELTSPCMHKVAWTEMGREGQRGAERGREGRGKREEGRGGRGKRGVTESMIGLVGVR